MASIQGLSTGQIKGLYRNKSIVYVEGRDDFVIYKNYWFTYLSHKVDFKMAEDGPINQPGCLGVTENVLSQRSVGVKAFGLLDRDAAEKSHCNEADNAKYMSLCNGSNPYLYRTLRWELENYLIDPEVLEQERVNEKGRGQGKRATDEVAQELVALCDILKVHAAANMVLHDLSLENVKDGFAIQIRSKDEYEQEILKRYINSDHSAAYDASLKVIEKFDSPDDSALNRLTGLLRRVHGKAVILRFFHLHGIRGDRKFSVAHKLSGKVPEELKHRVEAWAKS